MYLVLGQADVVWMTWNKVSFGPIPEDVFSLGQAVVDNNAS